ncbi:hypothetical protein [Methanococcus sp. CF]
MKIINAGLFLACILLLSSVSAEAVLISDSSNLFLDMKTAAMTHSDDLDKVPLLSGIASDERINLNVETESDELLVSIIIKDGKIIDFEKGSLDNATMTVYTNESTVKEILNDDEPVIAIKNDLNEGKIKIEGVGILNSIKLLITSIIMLLF